MIDLLTRPLLFSFFGAMVLLLLLPDVVTAFPERPPAGQTGGFSEPTCHRCHFDQEHNDPDGSMVVEGIPKNYKSEERYRITVLVKRPDIKKGGFQLAVRFKEGKQAGRQAGFLRAVDERVEVIEESSNQVQYAQHTKAGTSLVLPNTAQWTIEWIAPKKVGETIVFTVTANAANDDASQLGDYIYVGDWLSK
jgi:hypothetical protein